MAAFDLDCWRDGRLSTARLFAWIDALIEAGTDALLAGFDDLDTELWIVALQQMAKFSIPGRGGDQLDYEDGGEDDPWSRAGAFIPDGVSEDGVVFYELRDGGYDDRLREILRTARIYVPTLYWDFVYGAITESVHTVEESAARWQKGRLNDLGFPDVEHAMDVYKPLEIMTLPKVETMSATTEIRESNETSIPDVLSGTSLGRALAELSPERVGTVQAQLFSLANAIAIADRLPLGIAAGLEHALGKALEGVDRGLVALAEARQKSVAEIADTNGPRDLFRIGATLNIELRRPQHNLGELEEIEEEAESLDWNVPCEWLSEEDETLDSNGRPQ